MHVAFGCAHYLTSIYLHVSYQAWKVRQAWLPLRTLQGVLTATISSRKSSELFLRMLVLCFCESPHM